MLAAVFALAFSTVAMAQTRFPNIPREQLTDAQTREQMQEELMSLWERTRKTVVFVTHDIDEAVFLADRVVVLTARPARIREEVKIDLPRPRDIEVRKSVKLLEYRNYIWDLIRSESRRAAG